MPETTYEPYVDRRPEESTDTTTTLKDKVTDAAVKVKEKTEEFGKSVQNKIDEQRTPATDTLHTAASKLHESAENLPGGEKVTSIAHGAADKLEATAGYIRDHDVQAMMTDVENVVRRFPGRSLLIAAGVGFLLGRALRSDD